MRFRKIIRWLPIILTTGILLFISYWIASTGIFASSSKHELIDNYTKKEREIFKLRNYFNSIVPPGFSVYIEFGNDKKIDFLVYEGAWDINNRNYGLFQQWDINPYDYKEQPMTHNDSSEYSPKTKSLNLVKQKLGWNDATFRTIKNMLDKANCISVSNGDPTEIGFARSGMGKYSYQVFNNPLSDSLKKEYNDSCTYIFYCRNVVLEYEGGAIGAQCFPDK